jgi:probable HAF family extracellular repeat protein
MFRHFVNASAAMLTLTLMTSTAGAADLPRYTLTDLGTLGGSFSVPRDINNNGRVVGVSERADGTQRAFLYAGGIMSELGPTFGGPNSDAYAINDAGQVAGEADTSFADQYGSPLHQAFLYAGGTMTNLFPSDHLASSARAINAGGQVAGLRDFQIRIGVITHAFRYGGGVTDDLGTLGGSFSIAWGLNDAGDVVGGTQVFDTYQPFLYAGGTMTSLAASGEAYSINDAGHVAGRVGNDARGLDAFLYHDGILERLGGLGLYNYPSAVNANDQIVGSYTDDFSTYRPFVYADGAFMDLNDLVPTGTGWTLAQALGLNDVGQIVGMGTAPDGGLRGFLLTPVPEPTLIGPTMAGTWCLALRRRRAAW